MIEKVINPQTLLFKDAQTLVQEGWKYSKAVYFLETNKVVSTDEPFTIQSVIDLTDMEADHVSIYKE